MFADQFSCTKHPCESKKTPA